MRVGSGSIVSSGSAFSHTGSPRPSRPGQLDAAIADNIVGGMDPQQLSEISHATAAALLDRVHHATDARVVERTLTIVDREGVDVVAELWSDAQPDTLPGTLWRLYMLRTWMRRQKESVTRLWRLGEPVATSASAIVGVDAAPTESDIARTADSILSGAFTGDFAVALTRAATFIEVVVLGLRVQARHSKASSTQVARLLHTGANLHATAKDLKQAAHLWRQGKLE
ncbi:hypothetical protein [Bifidobacterium magnum]|uniref:Thymidine phosphorylase n=1 Tax=Bifidobacterium magnum TaxID=1692 RepID=A0A087BAT5_9BIFI|nr:hypothetical protein [Bifidobacterium magnum]KFI68135.1 hypothetical protein BMAGN_0083 [Bifidobacterium magnum]